MLSADQNHKVDTSVHYNIPELQSSSRVSLPQHNGQQEPPAGRKGPPMQDMIDRESDEEDEDDEDSEEEDEEAPWRKWQGIEAIFEAYQEHIEGTEWEGTDGLCGTCPPQWTGNLRLYPQATTTNAFCSLLPH